MQTQKIKNKKVIRLIYGILTVLLGVGVLSLFFSVLFFFLTLFNPNFEPFFPVVEIPLEIYENATLELNNGNILNVIIDEAFISFNVNNQYGFAGVVNYLFFIAILCIAFYIVVMLWKIIKSIKNENPFHYKNIWRIRKIAFAVIFSALLNILYPIVLKCLWIDKITILEHSYPIRLSFHYIQDIFWALIIFVVAEIYRIGLEMKKEQDLTI